MAIHPYIENGKKLYYVHVKVRDAFGKQLTRKKRGITSEPKAKRLEVNLKLELMQLKNTPKVLFWGIWFEECLRRMKLEFRESTVDGYRTNISKWVLPHLKDKLLTEIAKKDIHEIIFQKITGVSDTTKKSVLKQIKRIFNMAVEEGLLNSNPALGIKVKAAEKKQLCFNNVEINTLLEQASLKNHPWYSIWAVALMTGMRNGELYALEWTDVVFEDKFISVSKSWTKKNGLGATKNSLFRVVPISTELESFLKELKLQSTSKYVLPRIKEWTQGDQAKILRDFCSEIGITSIRFHDLRATFITQLLIKGASLAKVMKVVGHASIKTTMKYLRLVGHDVKELTEILNIEIPQLNKLENNVVSLF